MSSENSIDKPLLTVNRFPLAGIAVSAKRLTAVEEFVKAIPVTSGLAYLLMQDPDEDGVNSLPEIICKLSGIPCQVISEDFKIEPDHLYIVPGNMMLEARDGRLQVTLRTGENKFDRDLLTAHFFEALSTVHKAFAIGIVLSGTKSDGIKGLKLVRDNGGITFALDAASAHLESTSDVTAQAGVADYFLPPREIPSKLLEIRDHIIYSEYELQHFTPGEDEIFKQVLGLLLIRRGVDFSSHHQIDIRRMLLRRMAITNNKEAAGYLRFLQENKSEVDALYQDLSVLVTSYFRNRASFDVLSQVVFPQISKAKGVNDPIRIWLTGCSTGEEVYSVAACVREFLDNKEYLQTEGIKLQAGTLVQVFATDISETAIAKARKGFYPGIEMEGKEQAWLLPFFEKVNDGYKVKKNIRDMCIFAVHNFLKDPPFAKMDLVYCRNLFIYSKLHLDKKAFETFHYALIPNGFLLLGESETRAGVQKLFSAYGKNDKLFVRRDTPEGYMPVATPRNEKLVRIPETRVKTDSKKAYSQQEVDAILLEKFTPAGVVVNETWDILHFRGATGNFLEPAPGKASLNLLKMVKQGLAFELRTVLHRAKSEKRATIKENVPFRMNGDLKDVTIEAIPLTNVPQPHYLVLFHHHNIAPESASGSKNHRSDKGVFDEKDLRIQQLEEELSQTREDMHTITAEQEMANEQLRSANEELLNGSEELQSLNEELETSKEELQSTNEELVVINQEMITLNEQVTAGRNYAEAIITTIKEPLVVLNKSLRVKSANSSFYRTFMTTADETVGMPLFALGEGEWNIPELKTKLGKIISDKERFVDYEVIHRFSNIGERVMLLNAREMKEDAGKEKLILLAIEDITEKRLAQLKLSESEKRFRTMADFIPQIIWTAQPGGNLDYYNHQWYSFTGFDEDQVEQDWVQLLHEDEKETCIAAWYNAVRSGQPLQVECRFKDKQNGDYRWFLARAVPINDGDGRITKWFGSFTDIQQQKIAAGELLKAKEQAELSAKAAEEAAKFKQQFLSNMSHEIRTPMNSIIGFTKVLAKTTVDDKQREYLNAIKISGELMTVLINDILDLAKVDAGKMTFESIPFVLQDTLSAVLQSFTLKLQEKKIKMVLTYDKRIPPILKGDPTRLHQVMLNLISNAVKFTMKGQITIKVQLLYEGDEYVAVRFSITDTGIGIPKDRVHEIFDNFEQVHTNSNGMFAGTGLGLSIVKKLVQAQGGSVDVKSKYKHGSVFTVELKFQKTDQKPVLATINVFTPAAVSRHISVLLVEDTPLNQLLMKTFMNDFGFALDIADNGKMAISKLAQGQGPERNKYDIVLMDLQMPEMNGYEAAELIRTRLKLEIPIIAITADVTAEAVHRCKIAGMNDYIPKPVDQELLYNKINLLLNIQPLQSGVADMTPPESNKPTRKTVDLAYLKQRTHADKALMEEMIRIYLVQAPSLIMSMKTGMRTRDWQMLNAAAHKLFASFSIMGIDRKFERIVREIEEFDGRGEGFPRIKRMIQQVASVCEQACKDLEEELTIINN